MFTLQHPHTHTHEWKPFRKHTLSQSTRTMFWPMSCNYRDHFWLVDPKKKLIEYCRTLARGGLDLHKPPKTPPGGCCFLSKNIKKYPVVRLKLPWAPFLAVHQVPSSLHSPAGSRPAVPAPEHGKQLKKPADQAVCSLSCCGPLWRYPLIPSPLLLYTSEHPQKPFKIPNRRVALCYPPTWKDPQDPEDSKVSTHAGKDSHP